MFLSFIKHPVVYAIKGKEPLLLFFILIINSELFPPWGSLEFSMLCVSPEFLLFLSHRSAAPLGQELHTSPPFKRKNALGWTSPYLPSALQRSALQAAPRLALCDWRRGHAYPRWWCTELWERPAQKAVWPLHSSLLISCLDGGSIFLLKWVSPLPTFLENNEVKCSADSVEQKGQAELLGNPPLSVFVQVIGTLLIL